MAVHSDIQGALGFPDILFSTPRVKLKGDTNCRTHNVVYLISCGKCGKQYVGETKEFEADGPDFY